MVVSCCRQTLILQPLFEWSERLNELKDPMKVLAARRSSWTVQICTPEKLLVDHYEDKLVELRHDAEKRRAKGRPESQKQMDQFQRNVGACSLCREVTEGCAVSQARRGRGGLRAGEGRAAVEGNASGVLGMR